MLCSGRVDPQLLPAINSCIKNFAQRDDRQRAANPQGLARQPLNTLNFDGDLRRARIDSRRVSTVLRRKPDPQKQKSPPVAGRAVRHEAGNLVRGNHETSQKSEQCVKRKHSVSANGLICAGFRLPRAGFHKPEGAFMSDLHRRFAKSPGIPDSDSHHRPDPQASCCRSRTSSAAYCPASVCHLRQWPEHSAPMRRGRYGATAPPRPSNSCRCRRSSAVKIFHKARAFERQTRQKGKQDGALGRNGLLVLHTLIFDFLNYVTGRLDPAIETIAKKACHQHQQRQARPRQSQTMRRVALDTPCRRNPRRARPLLLRTGYQRLRHRAAVAMARFLRSVARCAAAASERMGRGPSPALGHRAGSGRNPPRHAQNGAQHP